MKITFSLIVLLFTNVCFAQEWQLEIMPAFSGYHGDLTQKAINLNDYKPALNVNLKYNSGDFVNFRIGVAYGSVGANDKDNPSPGIRARNLNFKSNIYEANFIMELNLVDPEAFTSYPYMLVGLGIFHFDPYTNDSANKKVYLQPLGTEGQGLPQYPGKKKYSLTQLCIPVGAGWKWPLSSSLDLSVEFGYRFLFTDYLDDVSTTYPDLTVLAAARGPLAASLSYRGTGTAVTGGQRGNSSKNDSYFFGGVKFSWSLKKLFNTNRHQ